MAEDIVWRGLVFQRTVEGSLECECDRWVVWKPRDIAWFAFWELGNVSVWTSTGFDSPLSALEDLHPKLVEALKHARTAPINSRERRAEWDQLARDLEALHPLS